MTRKSTSFIESMADADIFLWMRSSVPATVVARHRAGQCATPTLLVREMLAQGERLLSDDEKVHFLHPGIGTCSFYSAPRAVVDVERIESARGFESDERHQGSSHPLSSDTELGVRLAAFTKATQDRQGANRLSPALEFFETLLKT